MYSFGQRSLTHFNTLHKDLQLILLELIKIYDVSIISGIRTDAEQHALYLDEKSTLDGISKKSKHQGRKDEDGNIVSFAVDLMPYKKGTNAFSGKQNDVYRFYFMMGLLKSISFKLLEEGKITHKIRLGMDWDSDDVYFDQNFNDLPHAELIPA